MNINKQQLCNLINDHIGITYIESEISKNLINLTLRALNINWNFEIIYEDSDYIPSISLINKEFIGKLAHVNKDGIICVTDNQGLLVNPKDKNLVLIYYLEQALKIVLHSYMDHLEGLYNDLYNEYEGYFCRPKSLLFFGDPQIFEAKTFINVYINKNKYPKAFGNLIFENKEYILNYYKNFQIEKGIFIKLESPILPPSNGIDITWSYIENIIGDNQFSQTYIKIRKKANKKIFIVLCIPRPIGGCTILGIMYTPLKHELKYYFFFNHEQNYLLQRNGCNITDLKIMVIGCGSVGSEIIYQLASNGFKNLVIADNEYFELDNIYRNRLDPSHLNMYKSQAIATDLCKKLPYITVEPLINKFNLQFDYNFDNIDLIINSTGELNTSLVIDEKGKQLVKPIIHCWIDGVGVGGHAVLIQDYNHSLISLFENNKFFNYKYALILPNQKISKNLTGCAGSFIPFSYSDVCKTSIQVIDLINEFVKDKYTNIRLTWFGDNINSLNTSPYYDINKSKLVIKEYLEC